MTKIEAAKALNGGAKITHHLFDPTEHVYIYRRVMYDESDQPIEPDEFWNNTRDAAFNDGWTVLKKEI